MAAAAYRREEVAKTPAGYRVRSVKRGSHVVRVAFPPGRRKKGSGKVVEILHPRGESNPSCIVSNQVRTNPGELLIFGNPSAQAAKRSTRERAARIRSARLNPKKKGMAKLTPEEDRVWVRAFEDAINDGKTDLQADKWAGQQVRKQFPRLKKFRKFAPNPKGHKKGCKCVFCEHQRKIAADKRMPKQIRDVMRSNPRRRRKDHKRNPDQTQAAVRLFEKFHGRDPKEITEKHVSAAMRKDYTALGDLEHLKVITPLGQTVQFDFEGDGVKLASSPDGKQLYCIGGNQNLSSCLDAASLEKDFIDLGECVQVQYLARKVHAGFEPVSYYHKFGEKTGERPQLAYNKLQRQIFFVGGNYFIDTKQGVSPGIEN